MTQNIETVKLAKENVISSSKNGSRLMVVLITTTDGKKSSETKHLHQADGCTYRDIDGVLYEIAR